MKYTTSDEITKAFIKKGWNNSIEFQECSDEYAEEKGLTGILNDKRKGRKFFIMKANGNVYDECGDIAYYNI